MEATTIKKAKKQVKDEENKQMAVSAEPTAQKAN
jgi:hypothetical protein